MTALHLGAIAALMAGAVLLLAEVPWFRDRPLVERLRPYAGPTAEERRPTTAPSIRQVLGPLAQDLGNRISRLVGVSTDLTTRLQRAGRVPDAESFRLRQLSHALLALLCAGALAVPLRPEPPLLLAMICGAPTLALLVHEHLLSQAVEARRTRLGAELPVLTEQLGLLVAAGYSVTGAMTRLSRRSNGIAAADLQRVLLRIRHGVPEHTALAEWADSSDLEPVGRLTSILALHGETADLGLLIADEARSMRAEAHRELLETIERRAQLVWIPVTVATLVPGLVFLAVPFTSAMSQVTGGS